MVRRIRANVQFGTQSFEFELCGREITFGSAGLVKYYWMDSKQLRRGATSNARSCGESWWASMASLEEVELRSGQTRAIREQVSDNMRTLALAELYPLVRSSKGQQRVFQDAFLSEEELQELGLGRGRRRSYTKVPASAKVISPGPATATFEHLDVRRLKSELERLLGSPELEGAEMRRSSERFYEWMDDARDALKKGARIGLSDFLKNELMPRIRRYRKAGGDAESKRFLDRLIYNAKVAFYTCYANAWVGLVPFLREHHGLDLQSERFMRLWHFQNPSDKDVLAGQVLSLHPVSAILMSDKHHKDVIGRYLTSITETNHLRNIDSFNQKNPAFWALIESIRVALHWYAHLRDVGRESRDSREEKRVKNLNVKYRDRLKRRR